MAQRWLQLAARLLAALASAALTVAAFPPASLRALAWVALVPLLITLQRVSARQACLLGAIWGMAGAYGVTYWLPPTVALYYHQPLWLGAALFVSAAFLMGGIYYAAFASFYTVVTRAGVMPSSMVAGAAWVAAELGRARVLAGNPWGLLGYTQAGAHLATGREQSLLASASLPLLQIADVAGVYGLTFLIVAVNAALAELWLRLREASDARHPLLEAGSVAILLVIALIYGMDRIGRDFVGAGRSTRVAIVQGNLDLGSQWNESLYGRNLDAYLRLTHQAVQEAAPPLVFWPENAMTFFVDDEPIYRAAIARVTADPDVELVSGAPRYSRSSPTQYFNSAFVLDPQGEITATYDKELLLPFAEYFPLGSIEYLRRSFGRVREFTPGTRTDPLPTRAGAAGVLICNEAMFPRIARARVGSGAEYLVNLSNDTWVRHAAFAEHQFDLVSLRAVETRRYLVRASTSGPSAIVDPLGQVVARTKPDAQAFLSGEIRAASYESFYTRHGDAFAGTCLALTCVTILAVAIVQRKDRD